MDEAQKLLIETSCAALSIAYARHVDFAEYDKLADVFSVDAHLNAGAPLDGREVILKAMTRRAKELRSRHVLTNIYIDVLDEDRARGISYLTLYRHIGPESLQPQAVVFDGPAAVGHYDDEFVRTDEGWRIARRVLAFAFQNPTKFPGR